VWASCLAVTTDVKYPYPAAPGLVRRIQAAASTCISLTYFNSHNGDLPTCPMTPELGMRTMAICLPGVACTAALAGPPFLTDDPEPVALRDTEINLINQQTRAACTV
jgi:hypothetical protein